MSALTPPVARKKPYRRVFHGDTFVDNYHWMRKKDSSAVRDYISAQNAYTEQRMEPLSELRSTLFDEFKSRVKQTDMSVPTRMDGYWYYGRTVEGKQYGIQCRIPITSSDDWNPPIIVDSASQVGEQVIFDGNVEAERFRELSGRDFFGVGTLDVSKDGSLMLYGVDTTGDERYDLRLRRLDAGEHGGVSDGAELELSDVIPGVGGGACLSPDGKWVFYAKVDEMWRPYAIWRHRVGTDVASDVEAWREDDERFWVSVGLSFDERLFVINSSSKNTSEVLMLSVDDPEGAFVPVIRRHEGVEYDISFAQLEGDESESGDAGSDSAGSDSAGDIPVAVVIHNVNNPNFEIDIIDMRSHQPPFELGEGLRIAQGASPADDPELLSGRRVDGIEIYRHFVALSYRERGLTRLGIMTKAQARADFLAGRPWEFHEIVPADILARMAGSPQASVPQASGEVDAQAPLSSASLSSKPFSSKLFSVGSAGNPSYETPRLRYIFGSYTVPSQLHEIDPASGEDRLLKEAEVLGDFDGHPFQASDYSEARYWAPARDGRTVPVSLVWKNSAVDIEGGQSEQMQAYPMFITGYGAYEISSDPGFSTGRLSLLDRGVIYAVVHARGGGELGHQWYEEGRLLAKQNTFFDFIDATRYLQSIGIADPARTVANGGSAGGLLMGAIANMAPELYAGIEADVPFVDALTTILDPSLPLTITEWDEWGDPLHNKAVYDYMRSYSPYENVLSADERQARFGTRAFPKIFITTSMNDTRVMVTEPLKWLARLQEPEVEADAVIKIEVDPAGHGGVSGRYKQWEELAYENAWCLMITHHLLNEK
jgi:oligopeptidase B